MTELLAPAGDLECAKVALYSGADAIYCATARFGARAYAHNLSMDELKELLILAHSIHKKIYVTVNTLIKDSEWRDCMEYLDSLYQLGVDGIIAADLAVITYILDNLKGMECHISTQSGVKSLEDVRFFEELGAHRCVLARENSFDEIKNIKENSKMPLEVFAHGALCVSYSGGCLMSSMLTLRSGNRGRCSQNCRREYTILKDGSPFAPKGFHLSMKDLNSEHGIPDLLKIGVDSLKIEGRMKNPDYVKIVTEEYRHKMDDSSYEPLRLSSIFHRPYTKGFLFGEDRGSIVDESKRKSEGELVGFIFSKVKGLTLVNLSKDIHLKDRLRIEDTPEDYYFSVDGIFDDEGNETKRTKGILALDIYKDLKKNAKIYRMTDNSIDLTIPDTYKRGIEITVEGKEGIPLSLSVTVDGKKFMGKSEEILQKASKRPLDGDTLTKQLSKLKETSFYLSGIDNKLEGDLFLTVGSINLARRNLMESVSEFMQGKRTLGEKNKEERINYLPEEKTITVSVSNDAQYEAAQSMGITCIYYKNYSSYIGVEYKPMDSKTVLAGSYGALHYYKGKEIIADASFNVLNAKAVYELHKAGASYVTLSPEASKETIGNIIEEYKKNYGENPRLEMMLYGRCNLMTLKYCPLKRYKQCGICNDHSYVIMDEVAQFPILHEGCITHILNSKPTNLIDEVPYLDGISRFRLSFTTEAPDEVKKRIKSLKDKLQGSKEKTFDSKNETRGYYNREVF